MPDFFRITENYMADTKGYEDEGELYLSFPTRERIPVSIAEMDDIIEDAIAMIPHRFYKSKKMRKSPDIDEL